MVDVAPGIVTFGLGGDQSNMVVGNIFNIGFFKVEIGVGSPPIVGSPGLPPAGSPILPPTQPSPSGGGGSIPFLPGQIKDFYKPVDNRWQVPYLYPTKERNIPVRIRITFRGKVTEQTFYVKQKRGDIIITVLNMINTIKSRISVTVKNISRVPSRIVTFVRNIRNKDKE